MGNISHEFWSNAETSKQLWPHNIKAAEQALSFDQKQAFLHTQKSHTQHMYDIIYITQTYIYFQQETFYLFKPAQMH